MNKSTSNSVIPEDHCNAKSRYKKSDAVRQLQKLALESAKRKYPNFPENCLAPRIYRDDSANGLTRCIIDFLRFKGWQAERIANMGRQISTVKAYKDVTGNLRLIGSKKWVPGSGTNGTSDISATIRGMSVKIEVKYGKDRQGVKQKLYQQSIENAGGLYVIARSFQQFFDWYQAFDNEK